MISSNIGEPNPKPPMVHNLLYLVTGKSTSKLILSPSDYLYLNKGTTWIWMNKTNGPFVTWRQIYQSFTVRPEGVDPSRILGAEVCLWN